MNEGEWNDLKSLWQSGPAPPAVVTEELERLRKRRKWLTFEIVGSSLISNSVQGWFSAPLDQMLSSANAIAGDYYQERQRRVAAEAQQLAGAMGRLDLASDTARSALSTRPSASSVAARCFSTLASVDQPPLSSASPRLTSACA